MLLVIVLCDRRFRYFNGVTVYALDKSNIIEIKESEQSEDILVDGKAYIDKISSVIKTKNSAEEEKQIEEIDNDIPEKVLEEPIVEQIEPEPEPKELTIEDKISLACNQYGVSFDIALAIARLETGNFTSHAYKYKNNPGGLSINEKPMSFSTIEEGVNAFVGNLSKNYIQKGLTTVEAIGKKYCPSNPKWAKLVRSLM